MLKIQHLNGTQSVYEHLDPNLLVEEGEAVTQGEVIARVGPMYVDGGKLNGATTGPHLHFGILQNGKYVNPLALYEST